MRLPHRLREHSHDTLRRCAAVAAAVALIVPLSAPIRPAPNPNAPPRLIILHHKNRIGTHVYITDRNENEAIGLALVGGQPVNERQLKARRCLDIALYWGLEFETIGRMKSLDAPAAHNRGVLLLPTRTAPAVYVPHATLDQRGRAITLSDSASRILASHAQKALWTGISIRAPDHLTVCAMDMGPAHVGN